MSVDCEEATATAVALRLAVTDTGIGISEDRIEEIFERFTQIDASSTRRHGGIGLGLAISRELVALMEGTLRVVSRPNEGSTFEVHLCLPIAAEAPRAVPATPQAVRGSRARRRR